jgi:hypothetical protein
MSATLPVLVPDLIETTFANAGTVTKPPQTDPNGFVNYEDGYGADYEIDLDSGNTEAKGVERPVQNYLFAQMTSMAQWWQSMGLAPWYSTMANDGVNGYNAGALVGRINATSGEWIIWRSLVDANTVDPNTTNQTAWDYVPTDSDLTTLFAMPAGGTGHKLLPGGQTTEQILVSTDFNILVTGTFEYVTDAIAGGSAHAPSNLAGMVECKLWTASSTTYGIQRYCDRSGSIFIRGMQNGTWTSWSSFVLTYAAIIAALGFVPANSAVTVTAGSGLTGGGSLAANMTISLAPIAANSVMANPTGASAVPIGCSLLNGIILNSPANTLGLGTITPVNVASQGYVNGTTATFSGSGSFVGVSSTPSAPNPSNGTSTFAYQANGASGGGIALNNTNTNSYWGMYVSSSSLIIGNATTSTGSLTTALTLTSAGAMTLAGGLTTTSVTSSGAISCSSISTTGPSTINSGNSTSAPGLSVFTGYGQLLARGATGVNYWDSVNAANSAFQALQISATSVTLASTLTTSGLGTFNNGITVNGALTSLTHALLVSGTLSSYPTQGGYLAWNESGGGGEMDFINNEGGGAGGFNWYNTSGAGTSLTKIMSLSGTGALNTASTIQPGSDGRVKKNRRKITGALALVAKFTGVLYERIDQNDEVESGFIAQSVEKHFPHLVKKNELNGIRNFRTLNYNGIIPYLANAINELHQAVSKTFRVVYVDMRRELRERDRRIDRLEKRLAKLERALR